MWPVRGGDVWGGLCMDGWVDLWAGEGKKGGGNTFIAVVPENSYLS